MAPFVDIETDPQALPSAIQNAQWPVAFLVGAPLSAPHVPGVKEIIDLCRAEVESRDAKKVRAFEQRLTGPGGRELPDPERYQAAMQFLRQFFTKSAPDDVIRTAVRRAFPATGSPIGDDEREKRHDRWKLTPGLEALGALIVRHRNRFSGPVLTTNFDPLISMAARRAGAGAVQRLVLDRDGNMEQAQISADGESPTIVHLHGYWQGTTLHTQWQLGAERPRLEASLQRLLRQHTLVVMAYGGWDDVFTRALLSILRGNADDADVIWTFFEKDADTARANHAKLLETLAPAAHLVRFYAGIDCHVVLPELLKELEPPAPPPPEEVKPPVEIAGWSVVDERSLAEHRVPLTEADKVLFFDGRVPAWRHAVSTDIPMREVGAALLAAFEHAATGEAGTCFRAILGPGGEGKSTLQRQIAAQLVQTGRMRVLWHDEPDARLTVFDVEKLASAPGLPWLIASDHGDALVGSLEPILRRLHERPGPRRIHFLLATRDTDWIAAGGRNARFRTWADYGQVQLLGLTDSDAVAIVRAWTAAGARGLGRLSHEPDEKTRVERLLSAAREEAARPGEGAFFGAMLKMRFGEALREHLRDLLLRLQERSLPGGRNLMEAFAYVAAPQAIGIAGLDIPVLGAIFGLDERQVRAQIQRPLGEEAAATAAGMLLQVRHRAIAEEAVLVAEELGIDLVDVYAVIVRQVVRCGRRKVVSQETFNPLKTCAFRFINESTSPFKSGRPDIARAVAETSATEEHDRLKALIHASNTLRELNRPEIAIAQFRTRVATANTARDPEHIRQFFYEWSVCEGQANRHAIDLWLAGVSLCDELRSDLTPDDVKLSLAGIGAALMELQNKADQVELGAALRATALLGECLPRLDSTTAGHFARYHARANALNVSPLDASQTLRTLVAGIVAGWQQREQELPTAVPRGDRLRFQKLEAFFATIPGAPVPSVDAKPRVARQNYGR